jgi:hypothetical protein
MAKCKVLAFLLCENATKDRDGKIILYNLFDRIVTPRTPREDRLFFVYYKIVVREPCTVSLRVINSSGQQVSQVSGNWCDKHAQIGPIQSIWTLAASLFKQAGNYALELRQEIEGSEPLVLLRSLLIVDEEGD